MLDDPRSYSIPPSPTRRVSGIVGWFIGTMYILCFHVPWAQDTCSSFAWHASSLSCSVQIITVRLYSLTHGRMLALLIAKEINNTYLDASHAHASHASARIIFRLGSGAGRRSTTMARTPNYRARLWLLLTMAKFCSGTHVPYHPAAADDFLTKPTTAALRGYTHVALTSPNLQKPTTSTSDLHFVYITQWFQDPTLSEHGDS